MYLTNNFHFVSNVDTIFCVQIIAQSCFGLKELTLGAVNFALFMDEKKRRLGPPVSLRGLVVTIIVPVPAKNVGGWQKFT